MLQTYPTYKCGTRKNTCWNNQCSRNGMFLPSGIAREGNFRNGETKIPMVEVLLFLWEPSFCGQVSWTLFVALFTMNKASGSNGIPVELFQVLKDDAVKVLHSICQQIGKCSSGRRTGKGQFSFQFQECSNYRTIALISYASKLMLKIL